MALQSTESANARERYIVLQELRRQIADLRTTYKYVEAVHLAHQLAKVTEAAEGDDEALEFAEALIDLAELLIADSRSDLTQQLLQHALTIIAKSPFGAAALRERFSDD